MTYDPFLDHPETSDVGRRVPYLTGGCLPVVLLVAVLELVLGAIVYLVVR